MAQDMEPKATNSGQPRCQEEQDGALDDAVRAFEYTEPPAEVQEPEPPRKEQEIDEVMAFLKFSVIPSTSFVGTILFKFRENDAPAGVEPKSTYAVQIDKKREVALRKNVTASEVQPTAEVTISMDDFLYLYSGKASGSDLCKLFYAGRVTISGYAFRTVRNFAQSFDFSSEKWRNFYVWRDAHEKNDLQRSPSALEEARNVGSPSRDYWFFCARSMLDSYNRSKLQRLLWETSLASLFGGQFVLESVHRISVADSQLATGPFSVIASVIGAHSPSSTVLKRRATAPLRQRYDHELQRELTHFSSPCAKRSEFVEALALEDPSKTACHVFGFLNEDYVAAVKHSAKERQQRRHLRNRVDLGDAGMAQLDKLVKVIGKGGHSNDKNVTQSKYVPAPELLLREFRVNATVLMDTMKEKASGRKALHKIPAPAIDWLVGSGPSGNMMVLDDGSISGKADPTASMAKLSAAGALPGFPQGIIVEVNRADLARCRKRNFDVPKQRLKAKFRSISRELALQNTQVIANADEHLIFSDYL